MKPILITTLAGLLMGLTPSRADTPPEKEESVTQQMHNFWVKSKAYLSDDWATFKEGAQLTLSDLTKQIDAVATKAGTAAPGYFQLRLQALKEQRDYLKTKLGELDSETIKIHMSGPRFAFDKCVSSLEAAITQADNEADVIIRLQGDLKRDES